VTEPTQPGSTPEPNTPETHPTPTASARTTEPRRWLIPAATFLVGLLLGALLVAVLRPTGTGPGVEASPSTSTGAPRPTLTGLPTTATVVVPAECLQVAQDSQALVDLTRQAAGAARDLDAGRLSDVVRQIDQAQTTLRTHADACRAVDASLVSGSTPSVTTPSGTGSSVATTASPSSTGSPTS
jgi:hypothetical protein